MNDPQLVEDGFYEDCLELSKAENHRQNLRIALVAKGGQQGLDIRKFRADGRPTTGVLLDQEQVTTLIELAQNSEVLKQFAQSGEIDFDNFKED